MRKRPSVLPPLDSLFLAPFEERTEAPAPAPPRRAGFSKPPGPAFSAALRRTIPLPDPAQRAAAGLEGEITIMRAVMDWLIELFNRSPSLEQRLQLFSAYESASLRLSHLIRTQHLLAKDGRSEIDLALDQAIQEVAKEMGLQ